MSWVNFVVGMCNINGLGVHKDKFIELLGFWWVISSKLFFPKVRWMSGLIISGDGMVL